MKASRGRWSRILTSPADYLRQNAATAPNRTALLFKGARTTYRRARAVERPVCVGLDPSRDCERRSRRNRASNCLQFMIAELGIWKAGAIACPINPLYTDREREDAFNAGGSRIAVVLNRYYARVKGLQARITRAHHCYRHQGLSAALPASATPLREKKGGRANHCQRR